jgi:hypothetical protein
MAGSYPFSAGEFLYEESTIAVNVTASQIDKMQRQGFN